ncbi:hypothetical protein U1Q18_014901 [Sarracenia purpurea var. burkii]
MARTRKIARLSTGSGNFPKKKLVTTGKKMGQGKNHQFLKCKAAHTDFVSDGTTVFLNRRKFSMFDKPSSAGNSQSGKKMGQGKNHQSLKGKAAHFVSEGTTLNHMFDKPSSAGNSQSGKKMGQGKNHQFLKCKAAHTDFVSDGTTVFPNPMPDKPPSAGNSQSVSLLFSLSQSICCALKKMVY